MSGHDPAEVLRIKLGSCYVMFAYDAARSIDLDAAEKRIQRNQRAPDHSSQAANPKLLRVSSSTITCELWQRALFRLSPFLPGPRSI